MKKDPSRLANMLGALATGLSDRIHAAVDHRTSLRGEAAAALIVIGHAPGLSIDQLGKVSGLSHPGAVRMVDRLVAAGFAQRTPAASDRRAIALHLTAAGETERATILEGRRAAIESVLSHVSSTDRAVLERLVETMLVSMPSDATSAMSVCRLCNQDACANCPMDAFGMLCPRA
ncbi:MULTISPECIES: MarR family winged helix-turn-helix transcriptional regulator [unclassified Cupriavidus]|uniref:MarR family winged helix-turn-helix transcriptional regulator n=1 Tax=unclassified Cupriavidus TaxID=2640874 RepID=UPI001365F055|nr:MarR family winged helix-turn-helix transcriptional regulator [Cupriavidus sp. SW-Y-13]MWL87757.1 MarR family transcriptional regulator [Cupriavidus sp. SW-Y-13]